MKKNIIVLFSLLLFVFAFGTESTSASSSRNYTWYLSSTKASNAHSKHFKGENTKIMVIDDSLDATHREFADLKSENRLHVMDSKGNKSSVFFGFVKPEDGENDSDLSHGTAMTATIAGKTLGIAPKSEVYFAQKNEKILLMKSTA